MLDLTKIGEAKSRWISLGDPLTGVEVEVIHCGPRDQERFRKKLTRDGVLKNGEIATGREDAFFQAYAEKYVTDWRGDIHGGDASGPTPPYNAAQMGTVLGAYSSAFEAVSKAVLEEADFFSESGSAVTS